MAPFDVPHITHDMILRFMGVDFGNILDGSAKIPSSVGSEAKHVERLLDQTPNTPYSSRSAFLPTTHSRRCQLTHDVANSLTTLPTHSRRDSQSYCRFPTTASLMRSQRRPIPTPQSRFMSRRRPTLKLRALYALRRARATSLADGPGYLYAFVDRSRYWKLGMTSDFDRRKAQWDNECPCAHRRWLPPIRVTRRRRAAHLLLEMRSMDRPKRYCAHCRRTHIEIFVFRGNWNRTWRIVIRPLLLRVAVQQSDYAHTADVSRHPDANDNIDIQMSRPH
ncbi:hypothetical protein DFH05DRAFT_1522569 [Lentinula detonsa]|uniref:DUF1766-domain-containing protein n=1 Tax=Lentinula detonsa TaxID=2804962 RepID=A0A9W8P372_9AGAR|nr:hypothetical protein DFH05DRAFT_1522569 [Lentinula detonsa]